MARSAKKISNLVIDEISLVDKGANQHAVVTIAKNADGENKENEMEIFDEQGNPLDVAELSEGDVVYDEEGNAYEMELDDDAHDDSELEDASVEKAWGSGFRSTTSVARRAAARSKMKGKFAQGVRAGQNARAATGEALSGAAGRVRSTGNSVGGHLGRNRAAYAAGAGGLGAGAGGVAGLQAYNNRGVQKNFAEEVREELSKALTDAEREEVITKALGQVGHLAEEVEIAKAAAEEERYLRLQREYTEIAKSYNLPFDDEELGGVLMRCAEALPAEDCEVIHKAFEAAGAAIFEEYGAVGGGGQTDIYDEVEAAIEQQVSKSGVSREDAISDFFLNNPDAYDEYLSR